MKAKEPYMAFDLATSLPRDQTWVSGIAASESLQPCLTLCDPIDSRPPGSSVPGILQARILEWVAISFSNACLHAKSLQLCLTLCDPMGSSPPYICEFFLIIFRSFEGVLVLKILMMERLCY